MIKNFNSNRGVVAMVGIILILLATVMVFGYLQNWHKDFSSRIFAKYEDEQGYKQTFTEVLGVDEQYIYFNNLIEDNLSIVELKIANITCTPDVNLSLGYQQIDLGSCITERLEGMHDVSIITDRGVFSKVVYLNFNTELAGYYTNSECALGYVGLFVIDGLTNAHVSLPGFTGNKFCIKSKSYILGGECFGNFERLFYLGNVTNSHIWFDNSAPHTEPYVGYYNWQDICVSSSSGVFSSSVSVDNPHDGSICVGSVPFVDDVDGVHMGDCQAYATKIWLNLN